MNTPQQRQWQREYYYRNRKAIIARQKAYLQSHPEARKRRAKACRLYYRKHRDRLLAKAKARHAAKKPKLRGTLFTLPAFNFTHL